MLLEATNFRHFSLMSANIVFHFFEDSFETTDYESSCNYVGLSNIYLCIYMLVMTIEIDLVFIAINLRTPGSSLILSERFPNMICREELYSVYLGYKTCIGQGCMSPDLFLRFLHRCMSFHAKIFFVKFKAFVGRWCANRDRWEN